MIVLIAGIEAGMHWTDLINSWSDRLLTPRSLLLLWLTYPLLKALHELAHAFAVKRWGGEVREMGITLLAFTPVPYVDASASAAFTEKRHRIGVAATGMMVELLLASLALFAWLNVETGLVRTIAYNIVFIGGVSTLVFNGNPLLRYDGYYILSDLIEIPNLWQRSNRYLGYLLQRHLLGDPTAESPVTAPGERAWFLLYGPVAFCYRLIVLIWLVWLASLRFFVIGLALALWGAIALLIVPAVRMFLFLLRNTGEYSRRVRLTLGSAALALAVLLFVIPVPLWTSTQGVIWLPEQSVLRAGTDCEITELLAAPDQIVDQNAPLIKGEAPFLATRIQVQRARLEELQANYNAQPLHQRVERKIILDAIKQVQGDLRQAEEKEKTLIIRSPVQGRFVLLDARNLPGHFVHQGEILGYVLAEEALRVRTVIDQADIGLARERLRGARVLLAEHPTTPIRAQVERLVPRADFDLPSSALGTGGGGAIPVDPSDAKGLRALKAFFQLDLLLPAEVRTPYIGGRVYVRLEHGTMPLAMQWYRGLRQLLLRKFYD